MQTIRLETWIDAPLERCFKLSLNVDLHMASTGWTKERVVAGVTTGPIGTGEMVTWSGRHFGLKLKHQSLIDAYRAPMYFRDVMVAGMFQRFEHEHHFARKDDGTRMRDELRFTAPLGRLGWVAERVFLRRYLVRLLKIRNATIKRVAESEEWRGYLDGEAEMERAADKGDATTGGWEQHTAVQG